MSRIFVRERAKIGMGAGQPRFRIVASFQADLKVYVPHLRRDELEQIASSTGAEIVYLTQAGQEGEPERGTGGGHGQGRGRGPGRGGRQMQGES